jgi:hypothetical protein
MGELHFRGRGEGSDYFRYLPIILTCMYLNLKIINNSNKTKKYSLKKKRK